MKNLGVSFRHCPLANFCLFVLFCSSFLHLPPSPNPSFKYRRTYWFGLFWFKFLCYSVCCITVSKQEPKCRALNSWRPLPIQMSQLVFWRVFWGVFWVWGRKRAKAKSQTTVQRGCMCWSHCCKNYSATALNIIRKKIYFILSIYLILSTYYLFYYPFFPLSVLFSTRQYTQFCIIPL